MKTLFLFLSAICAFAQDFDATFSEPANTASVQTYSLWAQATNALDTNQWSWVGQCSVGETNISFASASCPANPCLLALTSNNATNQSSFSVPLLFDTNNFPQDVAQLIAPSLIKIKRHKK